jgi:polyribonucleotide nucleotidyltransferase
MTEKVSAKIGAHVLTIETGRMAHQADGAVTVACGDSMVFTAVVMGPGRESNYDDDDMVQLTVDYREKTSAAGRFPGGFFKREGRPTTKEILTMRLTDRPIRPLFPEGFNNEIQIMAFVLSAEKEFDPDILAMNAASAALTISGIPFAGPVGSVRMARVNNQFIVNPTATELSQSVMDLVVSGTEDAVLMVEGSGKEIPEEILVEGIALAHQAIKQIVALQKELKAKIGKPEKTVQLKLIDQELYKAIKQEVTKEYREKIQIRGKHERRTALSEIKERVINNRMSQVKVGDSPEPLSALQAAQAKRIKKAFNRIEKEIMRDLVLGGKRIDGRDSTTIRAITCEVGLLPRTHGSALFTRGETQALVTVTLGTSSDEQIIDGLTEESTEKLLLHYNFPPFSVGEIKPLRGPGRREIGHGNLAQMAIESVLPSADEFPYTIRIVSDIMASNGSSSMATVCGSTLSLMDAGVPIKSPVAGIAMGLIKEGDKIAVLSDILGGEDKFGDMDFKVAGTANGINAVQMDIKVKGLTIEIMKQALAQARQGRIFILGEMAKALAQSRTEISVHAPKILKTKINSEKIGLVIGPGGRHIKELQAETGTTIEIEQDGTVTISGPDLVGVQKAKVKIEAMTEEMEMGKIYQAKVIGMRDFGAIVELQPGGQEGMVHISELADGFVAKVDDVVKIGDAISVKVVNFDDQNRPRFSLKQAMAQLNPGAAPAAGQTPPPFRPRPERPFRPSGPR